MYDHDLIPPPEITLYDGSPDIECFKTVGELMVRWFIELCDLKPNEKVLDVGCGIGRIAIPLTAYLKDGSYEGFDIVPIGIEWCQKHITPKYPQFRFHLADIYNKLYFPEGRSSAAEYKFQYMSGCFDFVFLTSVFTHMVPEEVENYISEVSRVLKSGGRFFFTAFILNDEALEFLARGRSKRQFQHIPNANYWVANPSMPEAAIAHQETFIRTKLDAYGLKIKRIILGKWWDNDYAQDIVIGFKE
jgi:SAM-dependent methyltransferase